MRHLLLIGSLLFIVGLVHAENVEQCVERSLRARAYAEAIQCLRNAESGDPKSHRIQYMYGDVFLRSGQPDSAIVHLRRCVDLRDDYVDGFRLLGEALGQKNEYVGSIEAYQQAIKIERRNPTFATSLGLGRAFARADSFKLASLWISKAIELDPKQIDPYVELGDVYVRNRVYILAKEQYAQALLLQPNSIPVRTKLAQSYLKAAEYDSAVAEYNRILAIDSTDHATLMELADIYTQSKHWASAHGMYHRLVTLEPKNVDYNLKEGFAAYKARIFSEVIGPFSFVLTQSLPDSIRSTVMRLLAESYFYEKRRNDAADMFEQLLHRDSSAMTADDYRKYAGALLELKDTVRAFGALETYTMKDTTDCDICKLLGPRKMLFKDYAGAIVFFKLRLIRCDTTVSTLKNIGLCYQVLEKTDSAAMWYRMALAKKPYDGWATSRLANLFFQAEQRDSVLALYKDFVAHVNVDSTPPAEMAEAYKNIGVVYLIKKDFTQAVEYLKKAQTLAKEDCDVLLWLAQSYHNLQQKDDACRLYKEVVQRGCKNSKGAKDGLKLLECP